MVVKLDIDSLKRAAAGRWGEILSTLGGVPADILDGHHHPCPKCGGTDRFRYDKKKEFCFCNQCFSKKSGDGFAALQWLTGCTFPESVARVAGFLGVDAPAATKGKKTAKDKASKEPAESTAVYATARYAIEGAVARLVASRTLAEVNPTERPHPVRVDHYGTFQVVRIDLPTPTSEKRRKTFRPLHPFNLSDGREAWRLGYPPGLRPLFRQEILVAAPPDALPVICAGEKAVEAAAALGLLATTNAGGEKAIDQTDWAPLSRFRRVVVCRDNDPAGESYAFLVAQALSKLTPAPECLSLLLPNLPPRGDIVEWIAAGGTLPAFLALVAATAVPPPVPDPIAHDRALCEDLGIDVLGETPDRAVRAFSLVDGKTVTIPLVAKLGKADLLQCFGPRIREKVHDSKEPIEGMYPVARVREAIAVLAGRERAGAGVERGLGVWLGELEPDVPGAPPVVLVGPKVAAVWDGQRLHSHCRPRVAGIKVDLDHPAESAWFDSVWLGAALDASADADWCRHQVDALIEILDKWFWRPVVADTGKEEKSTAADLLAGLVLASWVQSIWSWRPMVAITAASYSGKSILFETLESIFGPLGMLQQKSTEPGIRQATARDSRVILCDEFEHDKHRKAILEFFRTSSRGGKTLRGSTGGHGAQHYGLQHICWCAAVELGLERSPDRNRFILFKLDLPPKAVSGKIILPSKPALRELGQRLLAVAIRHVYEAEQIAFRIKSVQFAGVHGRVVESYATPVGMLAAVLRMGEEKQDALMRLLLGGMDQDASQGTRDETDLLGDILSSVVMMEHGERSTVAKLLLAPTDYARGWDALAEVGIGIVSSDHRGRREGEDFSRRGLFIAYKTARRYLLRSTDWEGQSLDQHLERFPGARKTQQRLGGHRPWGIEIPWELVQEKFLAEKAASSF